MKTATAKDVHHECSIKAESLLEEAHSVIENSKKRDNTLIEKLKDMGFLNSVSIKNKEKDKEKFSIAESTLRYNLLYPHNNFLTEEAIGKICKKYGLLFAKAETYIGEIPIKNQIEMANFKLTDNDASFLVIDRSKFKIASRKIKVINRKIERSKELLVQFMLGLKILELKSEYRKIISKRELDASSEDIYSIRKKIKPEFNIISTQKNLSLTGKEIIGDYKVVDEDPVVFCKVKHGWLQVSAWGDESSLDEFKTASKN